MRTSNFTKFLVIFVVLTAVSLYFIKPLAFSIKQGLDLQGGTHVVLQAVDTPEAKVDNDAMQRVVKILEQRVNSMGLTEPIVQRQGERRIIIELPGTKEPEKAIQVLGKTAFLEFKEETGATALTGGDLKNAEAYTDQSNRSIVSLEFSSEGSKKFADVTSKNVGKTIGIYLDGVELTKPVVNEPITGGKAIITGQKTLEEANNLAIMLRSGALPVKVEVLETRTVGPTLGQDSKDKSVKAFAISVAAIVLFMLLFYRVSGFVACFSLLIYVMLLLLATRMLNATLTLPGIAGIILSMGMAVDANVLIFERFKEEIRNGKTLRAAIDSGFSRAFVAILDSNLTTIIAAIVLIFVGTGTVKGFGVTLTLGIILSMFTSITVTQYMLKLLLRANVIKNPKAFGASKGGQAANEV